MKQNLLLLFLLFTIFQSCESSKNTEEIALDYSNKKVLDSLIKSTPISNDTLFLGFRMGMNKSEFQNQIQKLIDEGKNLNYSKSNQVSTVAGTFDLGEGYTFITNISSEISDKTITGNGKYYLEPIYNNTENLVKLNIVTSENWDSSTGMETPHWLEDRIKENSKEIKDENFKNSLIDNGFMTSYSFLQKKGNAIIYETNLTTEYVDLNTLYMELFVKQAEKEGIKKENKDVKF